jgi:hypothetical protein
MTDAECAQFLGRLRSLRPDQLVEVPVATLLSLCEQVSEIPMMKEEMRDLQTLVLQLGHGSADRQN